MGTDDEPRSVGRRHLAALLLAAAGSSAAPVARAASAVRSIEMTFLKSLDPDPARLARFIRLNWLAMDEVAKQRGLMTDYRMLVARGDGDWNVLVMVSYPTERGFEAIREPWAEIVRAHSVVPIDGKNLRELGRIVASRRVFPE